MKSIYWYDFETFGADPRFDRPCQFAGVRTDEALNIIEKPTVLYCQQSPDYIPHPMACLITGITPQQANAKGCSERDFIAQIQHIFSQPQTCVVGYNNIRFDDEITRFTLYRNFFDPYEREWKHGNSRWDLLDVVRLCHAVRPEGIQWVYDEHGLASFRLETLTVANGIQHTQAHDALSDVYATIEIAKLLAQKQPKLYGFAFAHRNKASVWSLCQEMMAKPIVHVSSMYSAEYGCIALALPLGITPDNKNAIVSYDLRFDPTPWLGFSVEALRQSLFSTKEALSDLGMTRLPVKCIHANKSPVVAPMTILDDNSCQRWQIDKKAARRHFDVLQANPVFIQNVIAAHQQNPADLPDLAEAEAMLYSGGFFDAHDKRQIERVAAASEADLAQFEPYFHDSRLTALFGRYKARNFPQLLTKDETLQWQRFCESRLYDKFHKSVLTIHDFKVEISRIKQTETLKKDDMAVLDQLESYVNSLLGQ